MTVKTGVCQTECDVKVKSVLCRSAVSRQHIAPHRLHLHQLLTDDTADLDSYEVSASVLASRFWLWYFHLRLPLRIYTIQFIITSI